jgi:hypothetical protein
VPPGYVCVKIELLKKAVYYINCGMTSQSHTFESERDATDVRDALLDAAYDETYQES